MKARCWLIFLVYLARTSHADERKGIPLVTFGELSEFELKLEDYGTFKTMLSFEADLLNPGGFVVAHDNRVAIVNPNHTLQVLAGAGSAAYYEGIGEDSWFSSVYDVVQYNEEADVLVADHNNNCIRRIDRETRQTSVFAGDCPKGGTVITDTQLANDTRLPKPVTIVRGKTDNIYYYLFDDDVSIVEHNTDTDELTTKFMDTENFYGVFGMIPDSQYRFLYVTHNGGVSKLDMETWERTLVAGTIKNEQPIAEPIDGPLLEARFVSWSLGRLTWLIQDQVLIVPSYSGKSLRVIDLENKMVSTICDGLLNDNSIFTLGGQDACQMNNPIATLVVNDTIYILEHSGEENGQIERRGNILKLEYQQPICSAPPSDVVNGWYEPVQNRYIHMDTVQYRCDSGYGIATNHTAISCTRALNDSTGAVYGVWDKEWPSCEKVKVDEITPVKGQVNEGTAVRVIGIFMVCVSLLLFL